VIEASGGGGGLVLELSPVQGRIMVEKKKRRKR
jgi:hypothetical protein